MKPVDITFTQQEQRLLRELGAVVFRGKLILNAQPPITDADLAEVADVVDGQLPEELLVLWRTACGGELDYDYEITFGDHVYSASLSELFYPRSKSYHDLFGWIDHELEMAEEAAEERGEPAPERTPYLPFAGFEYLERFYVLLRPDEYGAILAYAQGIPWKGRLNEDSLAVVAGSVSELFDQLALDDDPFSDKADEYAAGRKMVEWIETVAPEYPSLAEKLRMLVKEAVFDAAAVLASADFKEPLSPATTKALRITVRQAVEQRDLGALDRLRQKGAPFDIMIRGRMTVLDYAMTQQAFDIVERLLDLHVDLGQPTITHANGCSDALLMKLLSRDVWFDEEAIYSAAETGAIDAAVALANSTQVVQSKSIAEIATLAAQRAHRAEQDAGKVERKELGSYLTVAQYRERAAALQGFAQRLWHSTSRTM